MYADTQIVFSCFTHLILAEQAACLHRYCEPPRGFPFGKPFPTPSLWPSQIWLSACHPASSSSVNLLITIGLSMVFSPEIRNSVIMNYHRTINEIKINIVKNSATNEVCGKFSCDCCLLTVLSGSQDFCACSYHHFSKQMCSLGTWLLSRCLEKKSVIGGGPQT